MPYSTPPANCTFTATVPIGMLYSGSGYVGIYGQSALVVARMYERHVNSKQCGVGSSGIRARIELYDVQSNASMVAPGVDYLLNTKNVSIMLSPEGILAGPAAAALNAQRTDVVLLVGMSGRTSVFIDADGNRAYDNVFGTLTPAANYMLAFIAFVKSQAYQRVAIVYNDQSPSNDVCRGAIPAVWRSKMQVVYEGVTSAVPTTTEITGVLAQAQASQPDVLISCLDRNCNQLFAAMQSLNFNVLAHGTHECVNTAFNQPSATNAALQYAFSPSQWDSRLNAYLFTDPPNRPYASMFSQQSFNDTSSAQQFYTAYQQASNGTGMTSLTSSQLAAFYVIDYAVYKANSTVASDLLEQVRRVNMPTAAGLIAFDDYGMNSVKETVLLQAITTAGDTTLVYPIDTPAVLPMPTFSDRTFRGTPLSTTAELAVIGVASVLTLLSILLALAVTYRRHHEAVRTVGYMISMLVIVGCIGLYWAPLTWGIYNSAVSCQSRAAIWLMSFTVMISPVTARAYRVHTIVSGQTLKRAHLTDSQLLIRMAMLWCIPSVVLLLGGLIAPLQLHVHVVDQWRPVYNYTECTSDSGAVVFLGLMVTIIAVELAVAVYYAMQVRRVPQHLQQFNSAKLLSNLVLLMALFLAMAAVVQFAVGGGPSRTAQFLVRSSLSIGLAVITQGAYFFDVLLAVFQPPAPTAAKQLAIPTAQYGVGPAQHQEHMVLAAATTARLPTKQQWHAQTPFNTLASILEDG